MRNQTGRWQFACDGLMNDCIVRTDTYKQKHTHIYINIEPTYYYFGSQNLLSPLPSHLISPIMLYPPPVNYKLKLQPQAYKCLKHTQTSGVTKPIWDKFSCLMLMHQTVIIYSSSISQVLLLFASKLKCNLVVTVESQCNLMGLTWLFVVNCSLNFRGCHGPWI